MRDIQISIFGGKKYTVHRVKNGARYMLVTTRPQINPKSKQRLCSLSAHYISPSFTHRAVFDSPQIVRSHTGTDRAVLTVTITRQKVAFASNYNCCSSVLARTCLSLALDYQTVLSLTSKFTWRNKSNFLIPNNTWYKKGSRLNLASLLSDPNYSLYHHYNNIALISTSQSH